MGKSSIKQSRSQYQHESSLPGVTCTTPDYTLWGFGIDLNTDVAPILPDHNPQLDLCGRFFEDYHFGHTKNNFYYNVLWTFIF